MRHMAMLVALGAVLTLACAPQAGDTEYEVRAMVLPVGQPDAGRDAFVALNCVACHTVAWDQELPAPTSGLQAPELGVDVTYVGPGGLASSIVAPSHHVSEKYRQAGAGDKSPMPPYSETMTIRQLADIVAYLQRQGLETHAKTGGGVPG